MEKETVISVGGMTCPGCELRIENAVKKLPGVLSVSGKYSDGKVHIVSSPSEPDRELIIRTIESLGYSVTEEHGAKAGSKSLKGIVAAVCAFIVIALAVFLVGGATGFSADSLTQGAGYGVLFAVGLITSLHCLFMCGSINLAVCTSYQANHPGKYAKIKPSILYNAGRVVTCTVLGGVIGGIGSAVQLTPVGRSILSVAAGAFMVLMGITMLNIFPALRKLIPRMPKGLGGKVYGAIGKGGPFIVGLMNGFMPCGALQSMQIFALGTGSVTSGALSMFFFSLGTVPLMFGFGALSSALNERTANKLMKVGAVMIIGMGAMMFVRGVA